MHAFGAHKKRHVSMMVVATIAVAGMHRWPRDGRIAGTAANLPRGRVYVSYRRDRNRSETHQVEVWIPLPRIDRFQRSELAYRSTAQCTPRCRTAQPWQSSRTSHSDRSAAGFDPGDYSVQRPPHRGVRGPDKSRKKRPRAPRRKLQKRPGPQQSGADQRPNPPVSAKVGEAGASPYQQAQAIYNYVIANMSYDKSGKGWGRGDAIYACNVRKGNCTDFHSLFIAIARSRGIPARFTIGFPLTEAASGKIPGYHCWAEFYSAGQWVPVDASEAWKHPERRQYYFGHLDASRVAFTMGRDLVLKPPQHGEPLNFLIYPYVEVDGKPLPKENIKNQFEYHDSEAQN